MCRKLFQDLPERDRAKAVDNSATDCLCERMSVSAWSRDPVDRDETLVRLVFTEHVNEGTTVLKSSFFSHAINIGASCLRKGRAQPEEYVRTIEEMLAASRTTPDGKPRKLIGVVEIAVAEIKAASHNLTSNQKGAPIQTAEAFCIYATGMVDRPNHADVMVNRVSTISNSKADKAVRDLAKLVKDRVVHPNLFKEVDLTRWT